MIRAEAELHPSGTALPKADALLDFPVQLKKSFRILWRIAVSIVGDATMAEDVVQEAAMVALEKLDQFQAGTNFTAWMGQTVRYVALNHVRREIKHRTGATDPSVIERTSDGAGPSASIVFSFHAAPAGKNSLGFDAPIADALREVADVARACLLLRTLDGLEYSEIAAVLGIPEGTAMSHVHRTRKLLRRKLADLGPEASDHGDKHP